LDGYLFSAELLAQQWDRVARVLHDGDAGELLVSPTSWLSKSTQPVLGRKP
jgi:hypothetical protein